MLTPTINIVTANWAFGADENLLDMTDLKGLNIINYEVLPHFDSDKDKLLLEQYKSESKHAIKTITNSEYFVAELLD